MAVKVWHTLTNERRKQAYRSQDFELDRYSWQAKNLAMWIPLGSGSGDTVERDYSLYGNHGTKVSAPPQKLINHPRYGAIKCIDLGVSTSDWVTVADDDSLSSSSGDFNVTCWFYPDNISNLDTPIGHYNTSATDGFRLHYSGGNGMRSQISTSGSNINTQGGTNISSNAWYFTGINVTTSTHTVILDGKSDGESTGLSGGAYDPSHSTFYIGTQKANTSWAIDGFVVDVRYYTRSLSSNEWMDMYLHPENLVRPRKHTATFFIPQAAATADFPFRKYYQQGYQGV